MLYKHQFNLQCFNSGQELKTYDRSQAKKHYGPALVTDIRFKKALDVSTHHFCDFLFEEFFFKFRKCNFSTHHYRKLQIMWGEMSQSWSHLLIAMARLVCLKNIFHFFFALAAAYQLSVDHIHWAILCSPRLNKEEMIISSSVFLCAIKRDEMGSALGRNSQGVVEEKCLRTTPLDLILGELSLRKPCWLFFETPQNTNVFKIQAALINYLQGNVIHKITGSKRCHKTGWIPSRDCSD